MKRIVFGLSLSTAVAYLVGGVTARDLDGRYANSPLKPKVKIMEIPKETKAAVKPALWGAAAGAIALAIVGFNWGGWVTGGTAETIAKNRAAKATYASDQSRFIEKGGWATMPGSTEPDSAVARACAQTLGSEKAVDLRG